MDEKDWQVLKALYEERSITKASEQLFVSQPAITKRIQQMENEFQVNIVYRSKKGVTFTSEGEYLVEYAKQMLNSLQETKDHLQNFKNNKVQGNLRIGVSINYAYKDLPGILREFNELFPRVQTEVIPGYSSEVLKLLQSEQVQVAIVRGDFNWSGKTMQLKEESICIVSKTKVNIRELPSIPRVSFTTDPLLQHSLDSWWQENFSSPPLISMEVGNSQIAIEMVSQGLGYAIVPSYCLSQDMDLHIENLFYNNGRPLMRNTWLIYNEKELVLATVREFSRLMEKYSLPKQEMS
ncbi:LysR family transcriptional regulator [Halalkalibacter oceani]|uniref:LysR family transcriptional regulator n=1 Tax=Halalkalibacter oceani TaxID=1653776 RepID=A0A9X2IPX9_9BACI|nr:LysR family transcriptional regulator [Halalkalibacter oceani]MCM3716494.1 LysR family transcriptional regulator [Halalkalibacter oceani]